MGDRVMGAFGAGQKLIAALTSAARASIALGLSHTGVSSLGLSTLLVEHLQPHILSHAAICRQMGRPVIVLQIF
jgi:hypothetical protein